jgi:hypothetical protein
MRIKFIAIVIVFVLGHVTLAGQEQNRPQYVGIGIRGPEGENWQTYQMNTGDRFSGTVWLTNQQPETQYLLTCLLDYEQIPCRWNDDHAETLYPLEMAAYTDTSVAFETPPLEAGFHDFIVIAFSKPFSEDVSFDYRLSTDLNYLYRSRIVLLVDEDEPPELTFHHKGIEASAAQTPFGGLLINRLDNRDNLRAWTVESTRPSETLDYYIHLGNNAGDPSRMQPLSYSLVAFLNYEQIPLTDENRTLLIDMPTNTQYTLSASFQTPETPGVYELLVIAVYNPYHLLETPFTGSERDATRIITSVDPSIRTAIVVEE